MGMKWEIKTTREWSSYGEGRRRRRREGMRGQWQRCEKKEIKWEGERGEDCREKEMREMQRKEEKATFVANNKDLMLCIRIELRGCHDLAFNLVLYEQIRVRRNVKTFRWHVEERFIYFISLNLWYDKQNMFKLLVVHIYSP